MPKKLEVRIGPHRTQTEIAHVNDNARPTVIDSELFVGRVLVKIRDFDGIPPDGEEPHATHEYFTGRNRRFDIQIEGRFKARPGVSAYRGDEIQFGSDFDKFVAFPTLPFKAGFRVAKTIDPNTYYDFEPPSGRPYIMSPYLACMNTFCAWPSPARTKDALVCLTGQQPSDGTTTRPRSESIQDVVPVEQDRHMKKFWHFIGLRGDPNIDALVQKNRHLMDEDEPAKRPMPKHQISFGTRSGRDTAADLASRQAHASLVQSHAADSGDASTSAIAKNNHDANAKKGGRLSALTSKFSLMKTSTSPQSSTPEAKPSEGDDEITPLPVKHTDSFPIMSSIPELKDLRKGDLAFANTLRLPNVDIADPVEKQLGPWRFSSTAAEPMEDNTFVFLDQNVPVPKRRKHFSRSEALTNFTYDSDVVYGTSFYAPFMNFNTFDLAIGPVHMNIAKYFTDMPVRYTLRSTRLVPGSLDEEVFLTISFQLVEVA